LELVVEEDYYHQARSFIRGDVESYHGVKIEGYALTGDFTARKTDVSHLSVQL
jgi:hypothetical protein